MQRAARDLLGTRADGADATRGPWLRHGAWREDDFPLRREFTAAAPLRSPRADYPFVRVEGDGVHEIAVGPMHAGIIEPGHFRFSVVGEKVLRLEEHLGYAHKGIEQALRPDLAPLDGASPRGTRLGRLHRRLCLGLLHGAGGGARRARSRRARSWLRALMLERERVANHLGDLGALGNDAASASAWRSSRACKRGLAAR